jgi:hypothetical protein
MKAGKKTSVTPAFNWKATLAIFIIAIAGLFAVNEYFKYESNLPDDQTGDVILIINVTITINFLNASQEQELFNFEGKPERVRHVIPTFCTHLHVISKRISHHLD